MLKVFINGSSGTTGLRLHERLSRRSDIELLHIEEEFRKDPEAIAAMLYKADISFFCLPDDGARQGLELSKGKDVRIIDTSTAHRTLEGWAYGFPELSRRFYEKISESSQTAVPGCHASGFIALVYPLIEAGLLPKDYPLACTSMTGYSGGGKGMISDYESKERTEELDTPRLYALGQEHKHLTEMKAICGLEFPPVFLPYVCDYYSGMLVTIPIHTGLLQKKAGKSDVAGIFKNHYSQGGLVKFLDDPPDAMISSGIMSGRDDMTVFVTGNDERILLNAHFDNLGKGASGAAIQCLNIMTGKSQDYGLVTG